MCECVHVWHVRQVLTLLTCPSLNKYLLTYLLTTNKLKVSKHLRLIQQMIMTIRVTTTRAPPTPTATPTIRGKLLVLLSPTTGPVVATPH